MGAGADGRGLVKAVFDFAGGFNVAAGGLAACCTEALAVAEAGFTALAAGLGAEVAVCCINNA